MGVRSMIQSASVLMLCFACLGFAAQTVERLEFEVATIKPSLPPDGGPPIGGRFPGCTGGPGSGGDPILFLCDRSPLGLIVRLAYGIPPYEPLKPDWLFTTQPAFEVRAKVPEKATREQFLVMLQSMLQDRFKAVVHHESREVEQYDLVVGKNGAKFKEAQVGSVRTPCPAGMVNFSGPNTMAILATNLQLQLQKAVHDQTGLPGKYDLKMCWERGDYPADAAPELREALQDQLGLKLESRKAQVDVVVIDHIETSPTPN